MTMTASVEGVLTRVHRLDDRVNGGALVYLRAFDCRDYAHSVLAYVGEALATQALNLEPGTRVSISGDLRLAFRPPRRGAQNVHMIAIECDELVVVAGARGHVRRRNGAACGAAGAPAGTAPFELRLPPQISRDEFAAVLRAKLNGDDRPADRVEDGAQGVGN